jgi:hypothetical protein
MTRMIRNVTAVVFLAVVLAAPWPGVSAEEECRGLGLVGTGGTCEEAVDDCEDDGEEDCQDLCNQQCGTAYWTEAVCDQTWPGGGGCSAAGSCTCGLGLPED